ncbi:MAG: 50S ribosomal protein L29, partial [Deltaproteobacteria bacterium]
MKPSEIREMTLDDIKLKLKDASKELFNMKFQHVTGR